MEDRHDILHDHAAADDAGLGADEPAQPSMSETFGQRLKRLREAKRVRLHDHLWSGHGFARQMGVTAAAVWHWEADRKDPGIERIAQMAELLGCSEHYLRYGEEHPADAALDTLRGKVRAFLEAPSHDRSRLLGELQVMVRS